MTFDEYPVCSHCGSTSIKADAYAAWNPTTRTWEIEDVFDKGAYCASCDGERSIEWREG